MKKRWLKPVFVVTVAVMLGNSLGGAVFGASPSPSPTQAAAQNTNTSSPPASSGGPSIDAKSAILMDAATGQVLFEQNADQALPPASMAKMMTEYLILDSISNKKINWDDPVTISEYSSVISTNRELSGIAKAKGDTYTVKDLFYAVTIYSDNGAAIALAEKISGTEEAFTQMMNETAVKMGLSKEAHFINTSGLDRVDLGKYAPASIPGETLLTARDAATIAYRLLKDHKEILEFSSIPSKKFRETDQNPMINYNWMLAGNSNNINFKKFVYPGVDGLKTGHTDNAGYCFTGTAEQNGMRLITVVMGTKEPRDNSFLETKKLFDYGFTSFEMKQIIGAKTEIDSLKTVPVKKGVDTSVPVVTEGAVSFMVKKGTTDDAFKKETQAVEESKLVAPIKQGQVVGTLTVTYNNTVQKVNLVAAEDVKKGSWIRLFFRAIRHFFSDLFGGIKNLF
jgi:D-alanyl-D-alanine carboxypeptidase (penicillin-binding protein 5/6)